ncbi:hypothetical protein PVK06_043403 [Gossypium arboreum]|uniref:Uncharacterized protein n=1 Tax=Gossypium arboreum TaxID=29729 RepID=A0ABR0MNE2_GOSAR|nr:hypothetical protein PVK06_043403 [Gossypium arboreum]
MVGKARTLRGVRLSSRGSNTLGSAATDTQSMREETLSQMVEKVPSTSAEATKKKRGLTNMKDIWNLQLETCIVVDTNQYSQPIWKEASNWLNSSVQLQRPALFEKFDLQGEVEDSNILSHVGKLHKEFKSILKSRCYKEMVQEGRALEEINENNPPSVHDDQWKWLVG